MTRLPIEILDLIMSWVKGPRSQNPLPWDFNDTSLACAARVCRTWHELATKYLWQDSYLLHVLRLLPRDAWHFVECCNKDDKNNHYHAPSYACLDLKVPSHNPSELCKPVFVHFLSFNQSIEWERLLPYTRKIRTLGVANEFYREKRSPNAVSRLGREGHVHADTSCRPTMLANNVCLQLQETLVPSKFTLFPALDELYIDSSMAYQWGIWEAFASSRLKRLKMDRNYCDTLDILTARAPAMMDSLRLLHINSVSPATLLTFVNLQYATICHADEAVWDILSTLPHLTKVITTIDHPFSSDQPTDRAALFPKLTRLSVSFEGGYNVRALRAVLSSACTRLSSLRIHLFERPDRFNEHSITLQSYVCSLCSNHLDKHILTSLNIAFSDSCTGFDLRSMSFDDTIAPLLNFNALKTLRLALDSAHLRIEPDQLSRIMEALPKLDYLSLKGCCIPVQGLQVLAKLPSPPQGIRVMMTDVDDIPPEETWNTLPSLAAKLDCVELQMRKDDRERQLMDRCVAYARVLFPKAHRIDLQYL